MSPDSPLLPPGEGWTAWASDPPPYKPLRVVELWRPSWGNDTTYLSLDLCPVTVNTAGLWWREG